ncbi:MAG: nuclear transport factor 2 family protein [Thermoplasmata archaeon]|nr:nuclear transport factor 2 family protein [Thermoplasmata archaeon]
MSPNKKLIETYLATTDKSKLGPLLADDVEWVEWADGVSPSGAVRRGKAEFISNYGDDELSGRVTRLTEEGNVVVAEGTAQVTKKGGQTFTVQYCDIFELEHGKIKRKSSFGALLKDSG